MWQLSAQLLIEFKLDLEELTEQGNIFFIKYFKISDYINYVPPYGLTYIHITFELQGHVAKSLKCGWTF